MKGIKKGCGNAIVGGSGYRPNPQAIQGWKAMRRVMDLVAMGLDDNEIVEKTAEEFGSSKQTMSQYLKAAVCALDDRNKDWKNRIIEQNYARLDVIIKECYEKGKHKEALQAIDLQNKLAGVYEQRLKIDSPIFTIKIGDNENDENINNGSTDNTTAP